MKTTPNQVPGKSPQNRKQKPVVARDLDFKQILWGSTEHARLQKMSTRELSEMVSVCETKAARARYVLWRRLEDQHRSN